MHADVSRPPYACRHQQASSGEMTRRDPVPHTWARPPSRMLFSHGSCQVLGHPYGTWAVLGTGLGTAQVAHTFTDTMRILRLFYLTDLQIIITTTKR